MNNSDLKLKYPPIVEAVLDIDCDLLPGLDFAGLEASYRDRFLAQYPKFEKQFLDENQIANQPYTHPEFSSRRGLQAFQFRSEDEKQIVQVRQQGFSFNRLAPYTGLDNYLPEIERTWKSYVELSSPVLVRELRLRYINRILLPVKKAQVELDDYLKIGPRFPDEKSFTFVGFLDQYTAAEIETGNIINIIQTIEPQEPNGLPFILDITVSNTESGEISDWKEILAKISALRVLKNHVFQKTLTEKCLHLFQ